MWRLEKVYAIFTMNYFQFFFRRSKNNGTYLEVGTRQADDGGVLRSVSASFELIFWQEMRQRRRCSLNLTFCQERLFPEKQHYYRQFIKRYVEKNTFN